MTMNRLMNGARVALCALAFALCADARSGEPLASIMYIDVGGGLSGVTAMRMAAGVFLPEGEGPFPVLIYSHGRSGTEAERHQTRIPDIRGHVRYWLRKGFAVIAPIRPGYGETGGFDGEDSGTRYDIFGNCWGHPEFARSADVAAIAVRATLEWLRHQMWADPRRVILAGASMGGLASIASAATNPDGVVAYINFSGGTGGNGKRSPEHSCGLEAMEPLMTSYGKRTHVPSLWLYAQNDSFWGAEWPRIWHDAYATGGSDSRLVMTRAVANGDGHQLLTRGTSLWTSYVDRFLQDHGF